MEPIYVASIASFFLGASAFIMIKMWVIPISKYKRTVRQVARRILVFQMAKRK